MLEKIYKVLVSDKSVLGGDLGFGDKVQLPEPDTVYRLELEFDLVRHL